MRTGAPLPLRFRLSLATQLISLIVFVALVAGGLFGAIQTRASRNAFRAEIFHSSLAHADLAAQYASDYVKTVQASVRALAAYPAVVDAVLADAPERVQAELAQFLEIQSALDSVSLYTAAGVMRVSGVANPASIGVSFTDREWYQQVIATGKPYLGLPVISRATGHPIAPYMVPILDAQGRIRGILGSGISLVALSEAIVSIPIAPGARSSLNDLRNGGVILAHVDPQRILTPASGKNEAVRRLNAGERGVLETTSSTGELDLIAYTPVPDVPWGVLVIQPSATALAAVNAATRQALLFLALAILLAALLGGLWALRIARPVRQLVRGTEEVGQGNLAYRIQVSRPDEIGQLAQAFNLMAASLCEKEAQLQGYASSLEQRIAERTQALQDSEARLSHLNDVLRAVRDVNQLITHEDDRQRLLTAACEILVHTRGFRMAWIGLIEEGHHRVIPVARAGQGTGYLDQISVTWDDTATGQAPIGVALRTRQPAHCRDVQAEPQFAPWREIAVAHGFRSILAVPMIHDARLFGAISVYGEQPQQFDHEEIGLLNELAGDLAYALQSIEDETQRQRAEETIRLLSHATEQSPASIVITDTAGDIAYVNPKFTQISGYTLEEVRGKNPRLLKSGLTPPQEYERLWQTITEGREWHGEFRNKKKNGEFYWESASISPVMDAEGNIQHFVAVKEDITARKQTEDALAHERNLLRTLIDALPDYVYVKDLQGRFTLGNVALARSLGQDTPDAVYDKRDSDFHPPELAAQYHADEQEILRTGQALINHEEPVIGPDGARRWLLSTKTPLRDPRGAIVGLVGINRDITERKQAEDQIRVQLDELKRWYQATLGRETRVLDLKREVNELRQQLGEPPRYPSAAAPDL